MEESDWPEASWFHKPGKLRTKEMFIVREGNVLVCHKDPGFHNCRSVISLDDAEVEVTHVKDMWELSITTGKHKDVLRTCDEHAALTWKKHLTCCSSPVIHVAMDAVISQKRDVEDWEKITSPVGSCENFWLECHSPVGGRRCGKLVVNRRCLIMENINETMELYRDAFKNENSMFVSPSFRFIGHMETRIPDSAIDCKSLRNSLRNYANAVYPLRLVQYWALQLTMGLLSFHSSGLYAFAQLRPEHIWIGKDNWLFVASVDVVRVDIFRRPIQGGVFIEQYAAPEVRGKPVFSQEGNWYSLGMILFYMMFQFTCENQKEFRQWRETHTKDVKPKSLMYDFLDMIDNLLQESHVDRMWYARNELLDCPFFDSFAAGEKESMRIKQAS